MILASVNNFTLNEEDRYDDITLPNGEHIRKERLAFDTVQNRYTFYNDDEMEIFEKRIRERIEVNLKMIRKTAEI